MKKMAVGAPVSKDDKAAVYSVSDSEDEEDIQEDRYGTRVRSKGILQQQAMQG
jgi:hypothetical protein